jgi:hypothetical protein
MFDTFDGLPVHILVIHATIVLIVLAALGTVVLAVRPPVRHRFGMLLLAVQAGAALSTWIAVESGEVLTAYPGLGSAKHADGGKLLLWMMVPFVLLTFLMVLADRHYHTVLNEHGATYRNLEVQRAWLTVTCVLAALMAVLVLAQTAAVGHSGAEGSWRGFDKSTVVQ